MALRAAPSAQVTASERCAMIPPTAGGSACMGAAMSKPVIFTISAAWDQEASVWSGHCDDIPAAADAPTLDQLLSKISAMALDLLPDNHPGVDPSDVFVQITALREAEPVTGQCLSLKSEPLGLATVKRHTAIMAPKHPKRPRDPSQLGKLIVDLSVGETKEAAAAPDNPAMEFARKGGLKGGKARAAILTPQRRRAIARRAAKTRWGKQSRESSES